MRVDQQRWLEAEVERLTAENEGLRNELRGVRVVLHEAQRRWCGSTGTRVDQILSPDELAELIEDCRRPPRPRRQAKAWVETSPGAKQ